MPHSKGKEDVKRQESSYDVVKALLFYAHVDRGGKNGSDWSNPFDFRKCFQQASPESFVTVNQVVDGKIGAGRYISREEVLGVCQTFLPQTVQTVFLPENVIAISPGSQMIWWVPAGKRTLFFKKSSIFKTGEVPLPALLFRASNGELDVLAMKDNVRPTPDTELFYPPFPNMLHPGYSVCTGNTKLPKTVTVDRIREWEKIFFRSYFTDENAAMDIKVKGIDWKKLWIDLCAGKHEQFPADCLVKFGALRKFMGKEA